MKDDEPTLAEDAAITCKLSLAEAIVLFELAQKVLEEYSEEIHAAEGVVLEELQEGLGIALASLFEQDWEHFVRLAQEELVERRRS